MTTDFTHFTDRHQKVTSALSFAGATVPLADELAAADVAVAERLDELAAAINPHPIDALEDMGRRWAKGELKVGTLADRVQSVPPTAADYIPETDAYGRTTNQAVNRAARRRYDAARRGATAALVEQNDRPEFSTRALIDAARESVAAGLDTMAGRAMAAVEALPDNLLDELLKRTDAYGASNFSQKLDIRRLSGAHIELAREVESSWAPILNADQRDMLALFGTMKAGAVRDARATDFPHGFDNHDQAAYWLDADGAAAHALGAGPLHIIVGRGRGRLQPLGDPLGVDADEFQDRLDAASAARAWLENQVQLTDRELAQGVVLDAGTLIRRAGLGTPLQATEAYLAQHSAAPAA
ncbi:hypothetical protein [Corynebacterium sp.]|uniref:hypothetical protein n=1 Tax=Corynebacterium sp. TaxID=1720 RepID=UPI0028AC5969|nr:hypothetical protein [Corynebacterium sp.]